VAGLDVGREERGEGDVVASNEVLAAGAIGGAHDGDSHAPPLVTPTLKQVATCHTQ
jgi:hypothetical protein